MIYTLTINPSIDYVVHLKQFVSGVTNRTTQEEYYIGGKGINVSCVLRELGMTSIASIFSSALVRNSSGVNAASVMQASTTRNLMLAPRCPA